MAQMKLQGPAAIVLLIGFVGLRLLTIGSSSDPDLHAAIRSELANDLGNALGQELDRHDGNLSAEDLERIQRMADREAIVIHATQVSKPLLSFGSGEDAIVKLRYSLPEQPPVTAYWRFSHGLVGGWRYRGRSSVVSYYLNFM